MAQSVKHLTLDFNSGHDLMVGETGPYIALCTDSLLTSLFGILSLPLSLPLPCLCSPLKINKTLFF